LIGDIITLTIDKGRLIMTFELDGKIRRSRIKQKNPYAYHDGSAGFGGFVADSNQIESQVHEIRRELQNPYALLNNKGDFDDITQLESSQTVSLLQFESEQFLGTKKKGDRFPRVEIKLIAKRMHAKLWINRHELLKDGDQDDRFRLLDPSIGLALLGYQTERHDSIGQYSQGGETFEVAGVVDTEKKRVYASGMFPIESRNFTLGHELGHVLMHKQTGLHRDRAPDGSSVGGKRSTIESEADVFSTEFLMPEKLVTEVFMKRFYTKSFKLTQETAFALGYANLTVAKKELRTRRDLMRKLASTEVYNGEQRNSIAKRFGVSIETMAIRFVELNLANL
jgi:Zn-dependent peptidase ImmA (M78 family)